jgi:hypothetical protein
MRNDLEMVRFGLFYMASNILTRKHSDQVPVIAVFTKFDDLISQIYDIDLEDDENRTAANKLLEEALQNPLFASRFPPKAHVCLEGMNLYSVALSMSQHTYT